MKSIRYVFCRGAFALGLMAIGIGSGISLPPAQAAAEISECRREARVLIAADKANGDTGSMAVTRIVLRQPVEAS